MPILLVFFLLQGFHSVQAQQKIAYVDIAAIMKALPEAQEAQRKLDVMVESWQKELQQLEDDWQDKFNDYDKRKLILTDQGRANTEKELQELDRRIANYRDTKFGQEGELFKKEDELMKPIQDLVFDQVRNLAMELGYDYVFDKSGGVMIIYAKESNDLTKQAIERIEKALPPRQISGQGNDGMGSSGQQQPGNRPMDRPNDGSTPPNSPPPTLGK